MRMSNSARTTEIKSTTYREGNKSHQIRTLKGNLPQSRNFTGSAQVNAIKQHRTMNPLRTSMFPLFCVCDPTNEKITITEHKVTKFITTRIKNALQLSDSTVYTKH